LVGWLVLNAIFNNISIISWWSVLFVEEIGLPEKTTDLSHLHEMEIKSIIKIIIIPNENKEDIGKHHVFVV
jgi:hypothetical protein